MKKSIRVLATLICLSNFGGGLAFAHPDSLSNSTQGVFLHNAMERLLDFIESPNGQTLFKGDFSAPALRTAADKIRFEITNAELKDKFNHPRCLINSATPNVIKVNFSYDCLEYLKNDEIELYSSLLHELLNLISIELPDLNSKSVYPISKKLEVIPVAALYASQNYLLHPNCALQLEGSSMQEDPPITAEVISVMKQKGYAFRYAPHIIHMEDPVDPYGLSLNLYADPIKRRLISLDVWDAKLESKIDVYGYGRSFELAIGVLATRIHGSTSGDQFFIQKFVKGETVLERIAVGLPQCILIPIAGYSPGDKK
jgi:hypothetical protein